VSEACAELEAFPGERSRRLQRLEAEREARQFQRYLDRYRIDRANINRIGPSRTAMLASYGIETAADVDRRRILSIPGFTRTLAGDLVQWSSGLSRGFRYNPNEPVDRRDIEAMDRELAARRAELVSRVEQAPVFLRALTLEIAAARRRLMPLLEESWTAYKIAEARRTAR